MKMKYSLILMMLLASIGSVFSRDTLAYTTHLGKPDAEVCVVVSELANWMEGQVLPGNTLMAYINTTHAEFLEFANNNNVMDITFDFYWKSKSGNRVEPVTTEYIDDIYGAFIVENWVTIIENADTLNGDYYVRIKINGDPCGEDILLPIVIEEIEEEEEELPIELPAFVCGDPYTYQTPTNNNRLKKAEAGDIFFIGGFPILLEQVQGEAVFSGEGLVPLPFGRKVVKVQFEGLEVNTDYEVLSGNVNAIADDPLNYPDFTIMPEPLNIGGDICLPTPPPPGYTAEGVNEVTGLDPWGFDPATGINSSTGTEYDQNGFNASGNHVSTGGPFNEQGCNREGFDVDGNPCDPSGGANPEAEAFAESVSTTIATDLTDIINGLLTDLTDSISELDCEEIRTELDQLLNTLQYPRNIIFGPNDDYYLTSMHQYFSSEPKQLSAGVENRNADTEQLEKRHVDLYHCDKAEYIVVRLYNALDEIKDGPDFDDIKESILEKIRNWTAYEYSIYGSDPDEFQEWLIRQIGDVMKENSGLGEELGAIERKTPETPHSMKNQMRSIFDFSNRNQWHSSSADNNPQSLFDEAFTLEDASFFFRQGDQSINGIDRAYYLQELARQQMMLTGGGNNLLPISVEKTVGNKTFTIYLDGISFSPSGASLDGYAIIDDAETNRQFVMKGIGISFGPTGTQGSSRLELVSDVEIRLNNAAMLILKGTEDTYIEWDCSGFVSMGIDAEVEFCRNYITPLDPNTLEPVADEEERYRLAFKVQGITSWLEFYATADAAPFAVTNYLDVKWVLTNMIVDFSSEQTPAFTPLEGYASAFFNNGQMAPAWKGFYVELLSATFPNDFSETPDPITASAFDILIDGGGFTGGVKVENANLIDIGEGNLGGWAFSIDDFELRVLQNQFAGAGMAGEINVPIFEENMEYEALIYPGSIYKFSVSPTSDVTADLFLATGELYGDSKIDVTYADGEVTAVATLNGKIHVKGGNNPDANINIDFPDLTFSGLKVSNQAPYFEAGNWGIGGQGASIGLKFNGFGLRLSKLLPYQAEDVDGDGANEAGLSFDIDVNLVEALGISAKGGFGLEGKLTMNNNGRQKWEFSRVKVNKFAIAASFQGVSKLNGALEWYEDTPGWGSGFRGILSAGFEGIGLEIDAAAQFGKIDDGNDEYKYFFVDALASLGSVGAGTGVLQLKGFGGGVSYQMDVTPGPAIDFTTATGEIELPPLGVSISGTTYEPNSNYGLGLRATAILGTIQEEVFNGTVSLSFLFNSGNGLEKINITGSGQFLKEVDLGISGDFVENATSAPGSVDAALSAFIDIEFNFAEPSFHGTLNVFLNAPPFVRGAGSGGKMVDAELHFDPKKWYIFIGRPEEGRRCGVIFEIPGIGEITSQSYLDVGTETPPMPPLPAKVREIAYKVNTNESLRKSGAGFVFGASLGFKLSASVAGIVSGKLEASAGFDMMLRKYDGLTCLGSTDPVGIDGWYATGQMWAYASGELKVLGVNVAKAGIAAVLQARLPNPFWAQATVGVRVKIGFIKVKKSLKLELGDDCQLVTPNTNAQLGMEVITFLEPYDGAVEIATSTRPKGFFALPVYKELTVSGLNGEEDFFVEVVHTKLTDSQGNNIAHERRYAKDSTYVEAVPLDMLPGNETITFEVKVSVSKNGSFLADETKQITFTTAESLCYIPEANVVASYPINGMVNFYKNEYDAGQGYIELEAGQTDLLINVPDNYYQRIRITDANGKETYTDYDYDIPNKIISFPLPGESLNGGQLYKIELFRKERRKNDKNAAALAPTLPSSFALGAALGGTSASTVPPGTNGPSKSDNSVGEEEPPREKVLYSIIFRVSEYNTFYAKIAAIQNSNSGVEKPLTSIENFGDLEMNNFGKYESLVDFDVRLDNDWIRTQVTPVLSKLNYYMSDCPEIYEGAISLEELQKAGGIENPSGNSVFVQASDFEAGSFTMPTDQILKLGLKEASKGILSERQRMVNTCEHNPFLRYMGECNFSGDCDNYNEFVSYTTGDPIGPLPAGTYRAIVQYTLPGQDAPSTSYYMTFRKQ